MHTALFAYQFVASYAHSIIYILVCRIICTQHYLYASFPHHMHTALFAYQFAASYAHSIICIPVRRIICTQHYLHSSLPHHMHTALFAYQFAASYAHSHSLPVCQACLVLCSMPTAYLTKLVRRDRAANIYRVHIMLQTLVPCKHITHGLINIQFLENPNLMIHFLCDLVCDPSVHNESRVGKIQYGVYGTIR